ncbi:Protein O-Mannosyl-Transferase 2 [Manis pentadactyla]|nr:Protein O-Mannosyl-Transferase 2 [Manis pentadactyla]
MSSKRKEGGKNLSHSTGLHTPRSEDALKAKERSVTQAEGELPHSNSAITQDHRNAGLPRTKDDYTLSTKRQGPKWQTVQRQEKTLKSPARRPKEPSTRPRRREAEGFQSSL